MVTITASQLLLRAKALEIEAVERLAAQAELVDVLGQLIHQLQQERGASGTYLASAGRRFADLRQQSVDCTRPVEARLRELLAAQLDPAQGATACMLSLAAWVLLGLDDLGDLRARIVQRALSVQDAVSAYTRLIAGVVELIFQLADAAVHPDVSRWQVALLHLLQGKEAAGQERAVGALLFVSGRCDEVQRQRLLQLIDAQERSLRLFEEFADEPLRRRWVLFQDSPDVAWLQRLRRQLGTTRPDAVLDADLSNVWFDVCSQRIAELWQLQQQLVQGLRAECSAQLSAARQALQDSPGLLRHLKDHPPSCTHAVDGFFDTMPHSAPPAGTM